MRWIAVATSGPSRASASAIAGRTSYAHETHDAPNQTLRWSHEALAAADHQGVAATDPVNIAQGAIRVRSLDDLAKTLQNKENHWSG